MRTAGLDSEITPLIVFLMIELLSSIVFSGLDGCEDDLSSGESNLDRRVELRGMFRTAKALSFSFAWLEPVSKGIPLRIACFRSLTALSRMNDTDEVIAMKNDMHFWWTTLIRGFIAITAGSAIMVIPDMAKTILLLPIAVVAAILGLAVYGVLDSVLVFVSSYMASSRRTRIALRVQGAIGVAIGVCLVWVYSDYVQLSWFLILIVTQSLSTAIAELLVARHSMTRSASYWNFAGAGIALTFSCAYGYVLFFQAAQMSPREISWLVFGYLLALGIAQCLTAARMLYTDFRLDNGSPLTVSPQEA